jgi:hypothetical protein
MVIALVALCCRGSAARRNSARHLRPGRWACRALRTYLLAVLRRKEVSLNAFYWMHRKLLVGFILGCLDVGRGRVQEALETREKREGTRINSF